MKYALPSLKSIEAAASGNGGLFWAFDKDGVVRRMPLFVQVGKEIYPTLTAEALRLRGEKVVHALRTEPAGRDRHAVVVAALVGGIPISTGAAADVRLHYSRYAPERHISAWELLAGEVGETEIEGAVVFVGATAVALGDRAVSTLGDVIPGVEAHAQFADQLIDGSYLWRPDWLEGAELFAMIITWGIVAMTALRFTASWSAGILILSVAIWWGVAWQFFVGRHVVLDPTFASIVIVMTYLACVIVRLIGLERDGRDVAES